MRGIKHKTKITHFFCYVFIVGFLSVSSIIYPTHGLAATLSESFSSEAELTPGVVVSFSKDNPSDIELASLDNISLLAGVVTSDSGSSILYSKGGNTVPVAQTGDVEIFVTDNEGQISQGDQVTISSVKGVGAKADKNSKNRLIGTALTSFDPETASEYSLKANDREIRVKIGSIRARLYQNATYPQDVIDQRAGLVGILTDISGRDVSYVRSIISLVIFMSSLVVTGLFVIVSLRESFVSLGRNPLAAQSIFKGLTKITLSSVVIVLIGTLTSYMVLVV